MSDPLPDSEKTICFDLDGTLCSNTFGDYESAEPFPWAIDRLNGLARAGHRIIILTARGTATGIDWEPVTKRQLEEWGVSYDELCFGKPSADVYVDDRAVHTTAWRCADVSEVPGFGLGSGELPAVIPGHLATTTEIGRTFAGRPLRLERHARRARELAERAAIRPLPSPGELEATVRAALERSAEDGDEQVFTISISAPGHAAFADVVDGQLGHHVSCRPLRHVAAALGELLAPTRDGGVALAATTARKRWSGWPLAEEDGRALHDLWGGQLCAAKGDALLLEQSGAAPSVAEEWLRELARDEGLRLVEQAIDRSQLEESAEAFIVGLPFCILPLASLDGERTWEDAPGPVTRRLLDAWSSSAGVDVGAQLAAPASSLTRSE